jgi:hypothetical protein
MKDDYVWDTIGSVEELGRLRMAAMRAFLADYEIGKMEGRYIVGELPTLPFENRRFDLALCSHFLFLYISYFSPELHHNAIADMCRVAGEVRVFPLLDLGGSPSPHVGPIVGRLEKSGHRVRIESVPYEFQRGGNKMLKINP